MEKHRELIIRFLYTYLYTMKKQCVRCGVHIEDGLRCERCRHRVDEEFRGEVNRPYEYYFRHHLKRQRALDKKIKDIFGQEGDFGSGKTLNRMLRGG